MYPKFLDEKLKKDLALRGAVDATVAEFEIWLDDSKLPFFPDYTDHGKKHLTGVLTTAVGLMTKKAKTLLTPADAAVLILATLLHDSAMHLSVAGFQSLIEGNAANYRIDGFDTATWPQVWKSFLFSALRWDDRKLIAVFGEDPDSPGRPIAHPRDPIPHLSNLTETDRKLIGEFIRQNHPRMAHEFALYGVPCPAGQQPIRPAPSFRADFCDLAGVVARSHGMPMRSCLDYLKTKYDRREHRGVHAVYLMALLRIADYLQIEDHRAPVLAFRYRHIPSKLSQQEWRAHAAVKSISQTHDDPEAIHIIAGPEDVGTFLRLQEWLRGIQDEMDSSWAVLGEVYGSHRVLRDLGLTLRRVRSNLDDVEAFAKTANFVPRRIAFGVATAELLQLMIRPLYGNRPEIGIRELLQNSLDAVRELWDLQARHPELKDVPLRPQEGDVEIILGEPEGDGYATLVVSDRGVGMTEEIIRDYFLVAGASYRRSEAWKQQYESAPGDSQDSDLHSRVLRSGRFGIGVLAAFLLGDEITVETRHIRALRGLRFKAKLASDSLEMEYNLDIPPGTAICVRISAHVYKYLRSKSDDDQTLDEFLETEEINSNDRRWDWYVLSNPKVLRRVGSGRLGLSQKYYYPLALQPLPPGWRRINHKDYLDVQWKYDYSADALSLVSNGLVVYDDLDRHRHYRSTWPEWLKIPHLSVFDPDGNLPLSLARDSLATADLPFQKELLRSVLTYHFANLLLQMRSTLYESLEAAERATMIAEVSAWGGDEGIHAATQAGITLTSPTLVSGICPPAALIIDSNLLPRHDLRDYIYISPRWLPTSQLFNLALSVGHNSMIGRSEVGGNVLGLLDCLTLVGTAWLGRTIVGVRVVTTLGSIEVACAITGQAGAILDTLDLPKSSETARRLGLLPEIGRALKSSKKRKSAVVQFGDCRRVLHSDHTLEFKTCSPFLPGIVEIYWGEELEPNQDDEVGQFWMEIFGQPLVPFDPNKRRTQLARAYEILDPYIKVIEAEAKLAKPKSTRKKSLGPRTSS